MVRLIISMKYCTLFVQHNPEWASPTTPLVFHQSFRTADGVTLYSGSELGNAAYALVPGRVTISYSILELNNQGIDLRGISWSISKYLIYTICIR